MDTSIVYPRYGFPADAKDDNLYEHPTADPKEKVWCRALPSRFTVSAPPRRYRDDDNWSYPVIIGFAGALYPLMAVERYATKHSAYSADEYKLLSKRPAGSPHRHRSYSWYELLHPRIHVQQFFAKEGFERLEGVFAEYNVPIFVVERLGMRELQGRWCLSINRILNPFEFYRQVDPYTAFQNLQMYITGVLRQPVGPVGEVPDEVQIVKKGFDPVRSFRKDPGTKKRRKRNG